MVCDDELYGGRAERCGWVEKVWKRLVPPAGRRKFEPIGCEGYPSVRPAKVSAW